jgi:hypothetical protein
MICNPKFKDITDRLDGAGVAYNMVRNSDRLFTVKNINTNCRMILISPTMMMQKMALLQRKKIK